VIREWNLPRQTSVSLNELARRYNTQIRGWMNYYGHFYKSALYRLMLLSIKSWCAGSAQVPPNWREATRAREWLKEVVRRQPRLLFTGSPVGQSRYGQWEPCESRDSCTDLREGSG